MKITSSIFLILISILPSSGQTNLDSLRSIWHDKTKPDTQRMEALKTLTWDGYLFSEPDSAFLYSIILLEEAHKNSSAYYQVKALNMQGISFMLRGEYHNAISYYEQSQILSEKTNDDEGIANALSNIGTCHRNLGDYSRALSFSTQSLKIAEKLKDNKSIAQSLNNIGIIHKLQGNMSEAVDYYVKSLKIKEALNDKPGMANSLNNIGIIYSNQNNYDIALEYYLRSLSIKEEIGHKNGIAQTLNNIGGLYLSKDDYLKAEDYYIKSLKVREELNDLSGTASSLSNLGVLYDHMEDHQLAEGYHLRGLKIRKQIKDKSGIAESMLNIGKSHTLKNEHNKSIYWCTSSFDLSQEIGSLEIQKLSCECLYNSYKSLGKGNQALLYFEKSLELEDSLKFEETSLKLQQIEFGKKLLEDSLNYVMKEHEREITHQITLRQEERYRNIVMAVGMMFLLLAAGLWSRLKYIRESRETIRKERDRSDNLLLNILPLEIAEELKMKGKADARDFDQVSILFTDFKEFTYISEQLGAKALVAEINHCFEAFDGICDKYGVEKIKTIGDSYMAAGGLPVPNEDSVKNTVLAALEMADFIVNRKVDLIAAGQIPFEMRTGIHTGNVVAGIVGVKKFQYDVWGDTVNTASRMESNGNVGQVNISQSTYELLINDPDFVFEARGKIQAKGKGEIEMYFVNLA